jgi:hypothetical protein
MKGRARIVALLLAAGAAPSFAAREVVAGEARAPTVVLLSVAASSDVTTEAMARVNGELKAAGFEVAVVPSNGDDARRELESAAHDHDAIAAFAIFVRSAARGTSVAEIWVSDRIRQKLVIQDAVLHDTDRGRGSEILAVRAVELLKASLADFWASSPPPPPAPSVEPQAPATARDTARPPRRPFASGVGVGVGVGVVESFGAMRETWSPDATASYGWPSGFSLRATFVGLGPAATLSATRGSASVGQQLALLEAVKTWWPGAAIMPFVTAGAGAQHVRVVGAGDSPYQGHTWDGWSLALAAGVGLALPLVSSLSFVAQARGVAAWPSAAVDVAGTEVGRVGAPALLADAGLFGTLP